MKKIISRITVEVLGSPKDHVEKALQQVIKKLREDEKGIKVLKVEEFECKQMDNKLWNTFADIEFETFELKRVLDVCYDYMPSTIEILEPAGLEIDTNDIADVFNDFLTHLHKYSMVLKKLQTENIYMMKELEKIKEKK
ncbi:MAG: hypothetical protein QT08_C0009G0016 [archaeon GW2011_AR17]|nr:MAG: hypothetical protein QT08_C0009G0016 [archaeon GW2011_AR17]MBS3154191.1 hypothetical protein [Candidatus Woesearchaeota archaeon]HIH14772.1 hypothetical protein [Nanoarchaeota archaeon]HIH58676.1 hypothetical protein [Nanoarchaeota archaeon]HII14465.1 hypothetical protein [Nanoarchaeota archaeon]